MRAIYEDMCKSLFSSKQAVTQTRLDAFKIFGLRCKKNLVAKFGDLVNQDRQE